MRLRGRGLMPLMPARLKSKMEILFSMHPVVVFQKNEFDCKKKFFDSRIGRDNYTKKCGDNLSGEGNHVFKIVII